jgi:hypothetical protein
VAVLQSIALGARAAAFTLVTLETMPCGCVAAIYRARPTVVEVDVVEAKGPHCRFFGHRAGQVMRLGVSDPASVEGGEPRV